LGGREKNIDFGRNLLHFYLMTNENGIFEGKIFFGGKIS